MRAILIACVTLTSPLLVAEERAAGMALDGTAAVTGMKCTTKGSPTEATETLAYLDPFVLKLSVKEISKSSEKYFVAAWFGRAAKDQSPIDFPREEDRGTAYDIIDPTGAIIPPDHPDHPKAIAFYAEASNKAAGRANLSKGIGGTPIPLIAATPGSTTLYSSMHQRFSFSLIGLTKKDFNDYGARYSIEQMSALPAGMYKMRLPFTIALVDSKNKVLAVQHGVKSMTLDLTKENRAATVESFKGSGAPKLTLE